MEGVLLDRILVGCAASLANLIIHAVLLGGVVWTVRRLTVSDMFVPAFLQYTLVIVAIGTLLVAGHFSEVVVWAYTYAWVGAARLTGGARGGQPHTAASKKKQKGPARAPPRREGSLEG